MSPITDGFNGSTTPGQGTAAPALNRSYCYDPIGNRKSRTEGDAATPANWRYYCANNLNQYTATDDSAPPPD